MDNSIAFYEKLGFVLLTRKNDNSPAGNRLAFLELEGSDHFLELCYSPDFVVEFPEDLMHTCVGVEDIIDYCDSLEKQGIEIWPDNWREKFEDDQSRWHSSLIPMVMKLKFLKDNKAKESASGSDL